MPTPVSPYYNAAPNVLATAATDRARFQLVQENQREEKNAEKNWKGAQLPIQTNFLSIQVDVAGWCSLSSRSEEVARKAGVCVRRRQVSGYPKGCISLPCQALQPSS